MDGIKREGSGNGSLEREDGKDLVDVLLEIQKDMSDLTLGRDSIKAVVLVWSLPLAASSFFNMETVLIFYSTLMTNVFPNYHDVVTSFLITMMELHY